MKLLLYCCKAKPYLVDERKIRYHNYVLGDNSILKSNEKDLVLNGKIVAECDYEVEEIKTYRSYTCDDDYDIYYETATLNYNELLMRSCLDNQQLDDYLYSNNGYAIHIKNLKIFDEPKELSNYGLEKAPQNMMRVEAYGLAPFILISIHPEWLCKILNGEKTIEVRKKVLKEMIK